jgi:hypothetical protein
MLKTNDKKDNKSRLCLHTRTEFTSLAYSSTVGAYYINNLGHVDMGTDVPTLIIVDTSSLA